MSQSPEPARLWPEQVVQLAGLKSTATLRALAARSRRLAREHNLKPHDLPVPDGRELRSMQTAAGKPRKVWQPYWHETTINAWLPQRRKPGRPRVTSDAR